MKKFLLLFLSMVLFSIPAWSLTIGPGIGTDVGDVDSFRASTALVNSGDQTEVDWINSILGTDYTVDDLVKIDTPKGNGWVQTNEDPRVYAFDFTPYEPAFFLVKTGNNTSTTSDTFLFENISNLFFGVVDLDVNSELKIKNIGKFSHVVAPVPEPATLLLLGTGLVGLAGVSRKKILKKS